MPNASSLALPLSLIQSVVQAGDSTVLSLKEGGNRVVVVQKVGSSVVDVDLNHPMAGKTLSFHVDVQTVRDASEEEIAHGHAHPQGDGAH